MYVRREYWSRGSRRRRRTPAKMHSSEAGVAICSIRRRSRSKAPRAVAGRVSLSRAGIGNVPIVDMLELITA
jgi:hypothetical protein